MSFHMLFSVALLLHITMAKVYYVTPDDSDFISSNGTEFARSLEYYLKNTSKYFSSDSQFHFKVGHHSLNSDLVIQNATNVTLTGEFLCIIRCTSHASIIILNVINFRLESITFENCTANYNNHLHTNVKYDSSKPATICNASILLYHCMSVEIDKITIMITEGNAGMLVVNVRNYSKFSNVSITSQVNCPLTNDSSNGILFYYDNWKNSDNKSSDIQLDNFQFTADGSCSHPIYYAITSLLFQNNANVSVVIQNTIFADLINVTALYYYGETSETAVSNHLTIQNCVMSNNIGNPNLKLFHITLNNKHCIRIRLSVTRQYNSIRFKNCKFENNFNMTSMIYVSPASSQATTGYFYIIRNTFHNNRNTHVLILKNDADSLWQLSNYVMFNETNITSNVHDEGQDLMSFTNSWVTFNGPMRVMNNYYYVSLWNLYISTSIFQYRLNIYNNTARQILSGSFILLRDNTTIDISRNTVYILLNQVRTYNINSEPICKAQFYTTLDNFSDASELSINVTMSNNIHMNSKYLPNYIYKCRWLSGNAFLKVRLQPEIVFNKIFQAYNNTVISEKIKRHIPMSICQCKNYSSGISMENDDSDIDCYSPHLDSIFPGQTLKVRLIIQKQRLYNNFSIPVIVYNTEDDDCGVVDTFQLSQTHFDYKCNSYSYTLWPKNENVEVCKLFIGFSTMLEMFYIKVRPCPLGFTLQEDRKSCYCDPVLNKNEVISIKSCNFSDETVLRPANSWISATRYNNTKNVTYMVSSYCPFEQCLTHQSNLNLSNPDSQCQFNRTGLLCGKCHQGLSTVFGSHQCKRCSNIYLLLIIPIAIAGVVFVTLLYIFNLTVWNGTIHTCIFYVNIININALIFFPDCHSFTCVILSLLNFDLRIKSCFYNGMDDYAKEWIQLMVSFYLTCIAILFIISSRYSTMVQRLTAKNALPVLATLFLFSYTKISITVCNVLFRYSTVTHLPSNKTEVVWSISTTTPLFGVKFLALFIVCIILFLILLPFNLILLFTRTLSCLRLITTFKPILDAYFGPYKDSAYFWTGLLLLIRGIVYVLLVIDEDLRLVVILVLLSGLLCLHAAVQPFKSKFNNIQECIAILNLIAVHAALSYKKNLIGLKLAKIFITVGVIYFALAIVFHCCMYRWNNLIHRSINRLVFKIYKAKSICYNFCKVKAQQNNQNVIMESLSNRTADVECSNYQEFQEPLLDIEPDN